MLRSHIEVWGRAVIARVILLMVLGAGLAGCSSIGTINGTRMGATNAPDASYCDRNPMVCVGLGAVAIGGVTAVIIHATKDNDKVSAAAPAAAGPGGL